MSMYISSEMAGKAPRVGEAERGPSTADQQAQSSGVLNLVCWLFFIVFFYWTEHLLSHKAVLPWEWLIEVVWQFRLKTKNMTI